MGIKTIKTKFKWESKYNEKIKLHPIKLSLY